MKFGVHLTLGLAVTVMGYVFHMQGLPLRLLSVGSKLGKETPTAT